MSDQVVLPALIECESEPLVTMLTNSLNLPRNVLAESSEIEIVWVNLKPILNNIQPEYRHELLARMVIAIRVGLFSSAVNEMWNTTMMALREKIVNFGVEEANQFLKRDLDEKKFLDLKDKELLDISMELGLLDEKAYFFLNHCREIRNNYSSAHPSESMLDGVELTNFMHQCTKHVLSNNYQPIGFKINEFMHLIKSGKLDQDTLERVSEKITQTNEMQKNAILKALFSIYVDERQEETTRQNCLNLCKNTWNSFPHSGKAEILALYSSYLIQSNSKKQYAKVFFERIGGLDFLPEDDRVYIIHKAIKQLESAHNGMDNFFNEEPFAERLSEISSNTNIPKVILNEYVHTVSLCYIGNPYGTSRYAQPYYEKMISNFSLREVDELFQIIQSDTYLSYRITNFNRCKLMLKSLLKLINKDSIPTSRKALYDKLVA